MKFTCQSIAIMILACLMLSNAKAQNVSFGQVPGHPLPRVVKANVLTTFELLYKNADGIAPGEALFHLPGGTFKGSVIGHNYRQGVIIKWNVRCVTKGNQFGYEQDSHFSIETNQTPNGVWFYPLKSDNFIGNYHFEVTNTSLPRCFLPNARLLLGKWRGTEWTFEFLSDGTVMVTDRGGSSAGGTYSILDKDHLKIAVVGRFLLFYHVRVTPKQVITMLDPATDGSAQTMYYQ